MNTREEAVVSGSESALWRIKRTFFMQIRPTEASLCLQSDDPQT